MSLRDFVAQSSARRDPALIVAYRKHLEEQGVGHSAAAALAARHVANRWVIRDADGEPSVDEAHAETLAAEIAEAATGEPPKHAAPARSDDERMARALELDGYLARKNAPPRLTRDEADARIKELAAAPLSATASDDDRMARALDLERAATALLEGDDR